MLKCGQKVILSSECYIKAFIDCYLLTFCQLLIKTMMMMMMYACKKITETSPICLAKMGGSIFVKFCTTTRLLNVMIYTRRLLNICSRFLFTETDGSNLPYSMPRAGSGVVRMDPLHFLAGCSTRRLNQA